MSSESDLEIIADYICLNPSYPPPLRLFFDIIELIPSRSSDGNGSNSQRRNQVVATIRRRTKQQTFDAPAIFASIFGGNRRATPPSMNQENAQLGAMVTDSNDVNAALISSLEKIDQLKADKKRLETRIAQVEEELAAVKRNEEVLVDNLTMAARDANEHRVELGVRRATLFEAGCLLAEAPTPTDIVEEVEALGMRDDYRN